MMLCATTLLCIQPLLFRYTRKLSQSCPSAWKCDSIERYMFTMMPFHCGYIIAWMQLLPVILPDKNDVASVIGNPCKWINICA